MHWLYYLRTLYLWNCRWISKFVYCHWNWVIDWWYHENNKKYVIRMWWRLLFLAKHIAKADRNSRQWSKKSAWSSTEGRSTTFAIESAPPSSHDDFLQKRFKKLHAFQNENEQSLKLLEAALNIGVLVSSFWWFFWLFFNIECWVGRFLLRRWYWPNFFCFSLHTRRF